MEDDVARLGGSLGARSENDVPARRERNGGAEAAVDHGSFEAYRTAGELDLLARLGAATQDTGEGPGLTAALVEVHLGERRVAQGSRLAARTEQQSEEESDAECGAEERGRGAVHQMNERRQSTTAMMPRPEDALGSSMVESGVPSACGAVNTKHPLLLPSREGNCSSRPPARPFCPTIRLRGARFEGEPIGGFSARRAAEGVPGPFLRRASGSDLGRIESFRREGAFQRDRNGISGWGDRIPMQL